MLCALNTVSFGTRFYFIFFQRCSDALYKGKGFVERARMTGWWTPWTGCWIWPDVQKYWLVASACRGVCVCRPDSLLLPIASIKHRSGHRLVIASKVRSFDSLTHSFSALKSARACASADSCSGGATQSHPWLPSATQTTPLMPPLEAAHSGQHNPYITNTNEYRIRTKRANVIANERFFYLYLSSLRLHCTILLQLHYFHTHAKLPRSLNHPTTPINKF